MAFSALSRGEIGESILVPPKSPTRDAEIYGKVIVGIQVSKIYCKLFSDR